MQVNLIGVVSAVHDALSPATSVKTRKQCFFELVDETEIKIKCTILDSNRDYLPESLCCGDVVCLRKVAVEQSKGKMVVKPSAVTSWLLFKKQEGFKLSSDVTAAPGSSEIFRLNELTKWLSEAGERENFATRLSSITITLGPEGVRYSEKFSSPWV